MTVLERNVAGPICLVLLSAADKGETFCYVAEDGRLDFDGLNSNQHQHAKEEERQNLIRIVDRDVPLLQACSNESSTSKYTMPCILRRGNGIGQQCVRFREFVMLPRIEHSVVDIDEWCLKCSVKYFENRVHDNPTRHDIHQHAV